MSEPQIKFGAKANQAVVSDKTKTILTDILKAAGLASCLITSTSRTPADQARAMYNNIVATSPNRQKKLYAAAGDEVIDVYIVQHAAGKTADQIKAAMEAKIKAIGPSKVSRHCADPSVLNVVDIAPSSITNKHAFETAVKTAEAKGKISRFITPPLDPAYHLEIPQKA
jgi:hypothetical protein